MTKDTLEVIYYYEQNKKATVKHIEKDEKKDIKQEKQVVQQEIK